METYTLEIWVKDKAASLEIIDVTNNEGLAIHSLLSKDTDDKMDVILLSVASNSNKVEELKGKLEKLVLVKEVKVKEE